MAYEKQTWVDNETPVDAEHLNHIEEGVAALSEEIEELTENITGSSVTVDETLTQSGQAADAKVVGDALATAIKGEMLAGVNLFDKRNVTLGFFLSTGSDVLEANPNYLVSDFIKVKPNTVYTASSMHLACFCNAGKNKIQNAPSSPYDPVTFTTTADTEYIRFSLGGNSPSDRDAKLEKYMLVEGDSLPDVYYPYSDTGEVVLTIKSFEHKPLIDSLKKKLGVPPAGDAMEKLRRHLKDPFVRTQIKLVGDSITAGMGGTGFSETGEKILDNQNANVLTATCWSNMLYHYIDKRCNRDFVVPPNDANIQNVDGMMSIVSTSFNTSTTWVSAVCMNTYVQSGAVAFDFFGDHIGIYYTASPTSGILDVYVDGTKKISLDAYSATTTSRNKALIEGLGSGKHTLRIDATGKKNANSTGYSVTVEGYLVHKEAIVKPWGIGGTTSSHSYALKEKLYSVDDDFVLMQYGTNDRHMSMSEEWTTATLVDSATYIRDKCGAEPILMASCPSNEEYESDAPESGVTRHYHMWDVKLAVQKAADILGAPFIDNYDAFWRYCDAHDVGIDALLADGLHPNDLGYEVMFKNIMRALGLPLVPSDYDDIVAEY